MAIESACIPLPSEIIMPFSGYLVSTGRFDLALVATAGAIGCNVGSTIAYAIGYRGGRPLVERWGGIVLMGERELQVVEWFFERFGSIAVFIGRLLPVVRTFIALPAGIARMPQGKFQLYTFLGSWPWCGAILIAAGALATGARGPVWWVGLLALIFLGSAALAGYHVGVEQQWIAGPTACTGGASGAKTPEELMKFLSEQQSVRCDEVQWTLAGLSLAGWNVVISLGLLTVTGFGLGHIRKESAA